MFAELVAHPEVEEHLTLASPVGFLALHGGLEPGTAEVAKEAAAVSRASLYAVVQPGHLNWHVPAHTITPHDAPALAAFLDHVDVVVSLHGYRRSDLGMTVLVGGCNRVLATRLGRELRAALPDYEVLDELTQIPAELRGVHPGNPVNRSRGGGVQLELPHPVRSIGPFRDATFRGHTSALVAALARFADTTAA